MDTYTIHCIKFNNTRFNFIRQEQQLLKYYDTISIPKYLYCLWELEHHKLGRFMMLKRLPHGHLRSGLFLCLFFSIVYLPPWQNTMKVHSPKNLPLTTFEFRYIYFFLFSPRDRFSSFCNKEEDRDRINNFFFVFSYLEYEYVVFFKVIQILARNEIIYWLELFICVNN